MDKPVSISVKAWIIRNMSVRTMTQESVIETVVNHQFDSALLSMEHCNSIEFSGFGRFYFNKKKALKKLEKFRSQIDLFTQMIEKEETSEIKRRNLRMKLETVNKNYQYLNKRMYESFSDLRGLEKQPVSSQEAQEADSSSEQGKIGDL